MKIDLTPDAALWVEAELRAGRFQTAEDAVRHAINQVKLHALRSTLDAAVARGGQHSVDDVRNHVQQRLDREASEVIEIA